MDVAAVALEVMHRRDPRLLGWSDARVRAAVTRGELVPLHRGWYVRGEVWVGWYEEQKHVARTIAVVGAARSATPVVASVSAVAMHGWPLYRVRPRFVHLVGSRADGRFDAAAGVARHRGDRSHRVTAVAGIPVTDPICTVGDVIGVLPIEAAVAVADAALREAAWDARCAAYDLAAADAWRNAVRESPGLRAGRRGVAQARWVVSFADGRAQLPGESVSRLYLCLLGFAPPRLQVPVQISGGRVARLDFALDDIDAWGEFDGIGKYTDSTMLGSATTGSSIIDEKWREDEIRGVTGRRVLRWGSAHIRSVEVFRARLQSFRVAIPSPRGRINTSTSSA